MTRDGLLDCDSGFEGKRMKGFFNIKLIRQRNAVMNSNKHRLYLAIPLLLVSLTVYAHDTIIYRLMLVECI